MLLLFCTCQKCFEKRYYFGSSFIFQQKSDGDEFSVAIAVRLHKTLELAGDKFYMITCGKAGFQNTR